MGHQNFGQILGLIFLSYKILRQCAKESKTATQHIFKAPPKNYREKVTRRTAQNNKAGTTALIFLSLNCKSTTNIVSDKCYNQPASRKKGEFTHNVRTVRSVGHCSEDDSTGRQVVDHRPPCPSTLLRELLFFCSTASSHHSLDVVA
jgi:hypothetical protein